MREKVHGQFALVPLFCAHEHARELAEINRILDECTELERLVQRDLLRGGVAAHRGRPGLTAQQVLRAVVLKQMKGYSYEELAFHLSDSQSYRAFCRFEIICPALKRSTLQENVARISPGPGSNSTRCWSHMPARRVSKQGRRCGDRKSVV